MKVLVISHMYPSKENQTNGVFVHEQIQELVRKDIEVVVISPVPFVPPFIKGKSSKWEKYEMIPTFDYIENIEVHYPRYISLPRNINFNRAGHRMYVGIKKTIKNIYREFKFDLIHAHVALPDGYAASRISKKYEVPLITTIHGQDFQHTIHKNTKCKKIVNEVLEKSKINILVSSKLDNIRNEHFPQVKSSKFKVINNGVSNIFLEKNNSILESEKKSNNLKILSVSNLIKSKGIDLNLYAISEIKKEHPNILYQIIGEGNEEKNLRQLAKELKVEKNVVFLGRKSREDVKGFMSDADIFLLPSWNEAFGVVYIEAMSRGTSVIGCKGEGIEDIVDDGVDGLLVKRKDVKDIIKKTLFLINNFEERVIMGMKAKEKVQQSYTWEEVSKKIIEQYKKVQVETHK